MSKREMEAPRAMSTYKRADGQLIAGEFGWVADREYIEESDDFGEPTEYVREDWILCNRRTFWFPDHVLCSECGDTDVPLPADYEAGKVLVCDDCLAERDLETLR
jgi:hypothetical protein